MTTDSRAGMLLTWMDVAPIHEDDFNRWYDREHVEERVRIPGFCSGARYENLKGLRKYLGLYRTRSLSVFETAAYRQAFQHQTPWSVINLTRMKNAMRRVCSIEAETGAGMGAWISLLRLGTASIDPDAAARLGTRLSTMDGVVSSCLLVPDVALSTPLPAESPQGRVLDSIFLIDASSERAARAAGRLAADEVLSDDVSILRMMWQLRHSDLTSTP